MTLEEKLKLHINDYPNIDFKGLKDFENKFTVSFVIPCYNSSESILEVLDCISILEGREQIKEVIIINDASTDNTVKLIESFSKKSDFKIVLINNKKRLSSSKARNLGINNANGELVFFLDSDILIPPDYIKVHSFIHSQINKCITLSFRSYINKDSYKRKEKKFPIKKYINEFRLYKKVPPSWFSQRGLEEPKDIKRLHLYKDTNGFRKLSIERNAKYLWTLPEVTLIGASCIKRKHLKNTLFNTRFKGWGYEDIEFSARLIAKGLYVIPVIKLGVYHLSHKKRLPSYSDDFKRNMELYNKILKSEYIE
jgi:glycosyltransferase involved in cell wall biosynthesis